MPWPVAAVSYLAMSFSRMAIFSRSTMIVIFVRWRRCVSFMSVVMIRTVVRVIISRLWRITT